MFYFIKKIKMGGFNFVLAEVGDVLCVKTKQKIQIIKKNCEPGMRLSCAAVQTYVSTTYT